MANFGSRSLLFLFSPTFLSLNWAEANFRPGGVQGLVWLLPIGPCWKGLGSFSAWESWALPSTTHALGRISSATSSQARLGVAGLVPPGYQTVLASSPEISFLLRSSQFLLFHPQAHEPDQLPTSTSSTPESSPPKTQRPQSSQREEEKTDSYLVQGFACN